MARARPSLALEAVRELISNDTERRSDGAFFVDLAAVTDPAGLRIGRRRPGLGYGMARQAPHTHHCWSA